MIVCATGHAPERLERNRLNAFPPALKRCTNERGPLRRIPLPGQPAQLAGEIT